jgi:hypothetical protein
MKSKKLIQRFLVAIIITLSLDVPGYAIANNDKGFPLGYSSHILIKQKIQNGDTELKEELNHLIMDSDSILSMTPLSVMNDDNAPSGFDPHNYVSYAPYWWANPLLLAQAYYKYQSKKYLDALILAESRNPEQHSFQYKLIIPDNK